MSYHPIGQNIDVSAGAARPLMPPCLSQEQKSAAEAACAQSRQIKGLGIELVGLFTGGYIPPLSQIDPCWLSTLPVCPPGSAVPEGGDTTGIETGEGGGEEEDGSRRALAVGGILLLIAAGTGGYLYYRHRKGRRR